MEGFVPPGSTLFWIWVPFTRKNRDTHECHGFWDPSRDPAGTDRGSISMQKRIFNGLSLPPRDPWPLFINSKMQVFRMDDRVLCLDDWKELLVVLKSCLQSVRIWFLKTIINSWSTSHRLSESVFLPCIFGCNDCEDNLKHYLWCIPLWTLASSAFSLPSCFLCLPPADRLCLWAMV